MKTNKKIKNVVISESTRMLIEAAGNENVRKQIEAALSLDAKSKIIGVTFITDNYGTLKQLKGNREVNNKNVEKIVGSIQGNGYMVTKAIVCDENGQIVDGIHRQKGCERLGHPLVFTVQPTDKNSLEIAQKMNSNQKNWGMSDYIRSFKECGVADYVKFSLMIEEEGITTSLGLWLLYRSRNGDVQQLVREGRLECSQEDIMKISCTLNAIRELQNQVPDITSRSRRIKKAFLSDKVAIPLTKLMCQPQYKQARMIKQVRNLYALIDIRNMSNAGQTLVDIYNYYLPMDATRRIADYSTL